MERNQSHYNSSGGSSYQNRNRDRSGGYRGFSRQNRFGKNRGFRNQRSNRGRFIGEKIPYEKYISKTVENYIAPSIYAEDRLFSEYAISELIKRNISSKGYNHPTLVQSQAIPHILQGKDVLGRASTGSGKTGAFLIPLIDKVLKDKLQKCLIIVPTRELASQIRTELIELSRGSGIFSVLIIGGVSMGMQINDLRRNPSFIIGTPGRLKDLYERNKINLETFNNIVLDEVDRMLDMGFIGDITLLISKLREKKQTLFFSATMSFEAEKIADTLLSNPVKLKIEEESPLKSVNQNVVMVQNSEQKLPTLVSLLTKEEFTKVLIFSRTKHGADNLTKKLKAQNLRVEAIHGNKTQQKRLRVISDFKLNRINILVATDVAARGLDIPNVSHVINYDEPQTFKDYIHRIGRTGRAGKPGNALTFVGC
ncbi:DEAD/DEAH box helicase [Candidatus Dojkabacteria bacterium]|nr:DEAD/DEAH box helicase [Candidatus Dojkabacteria bacterium]